MKALCERFYNETARIENMFLLAGSLADESLPQVVKDLLEDEDWDTLEACFGEIPAHVKEDVEAHDDEALPAWLLHSGKLGFVVQMATPIMGAFGSESSYSWGYYTTKWVYGDTLDAALKVGFVWVAEQREKEKAKGERF